MKQSGNFDFFVGMIWHASVARSSLLRFKDFWDERGFAMYVAGCIRLSESYWVLMWYDASILFPLVYLIVPCDKSEKREQKDGKTMRVRRRRRRLSVYFATGHQPILI